jgi:hypothetical protein
MDIGLPLALIVNFSVVLPFFLNCGYSPIPLKNLLKASLRLAKANSVTFPQIHESDSQGKAGLTELLKNFLRV